SLRISGGALRSQQNRPPSPVRWIRLLDAVSDITCVPPLKVSTSKGHPCFRWLGLDSRGSPVSKVRRCGQHDFCKWYSEPPMLGKVHQDPATMSSLSIASKA